MKLSKVNVGNFCIISSINLPKKSQKRLIELGIFVGAKIKVCKKRNNAFLIILATDTFYAIRYENANQIEVKVYE